MSLLLLSLHLSALLSFLSYKTPYNLFLCHPNHHSFLNLPFFLPLPKVELFCVDQLIMVEIVTEDEFTHFNFQFPTNKVAGEASVSGTEAVFQILRQVHTIFHVVPICSTVTGEVRMPLRVYY